MPTRNSLTVKTVNPEHYKKEVIALWNSHGFSSEQTFIWYYLKNPNPIYLFGLIDLDESGRLVGTASIALRHFYWRGQTLSGGLIGNIFVDKDYRYQQRKTTDLISPSLNLLQHCLVVGKEKFDFVYVYPVRAAHTALVRAGFCRHYNFTRYGKLLDVEKILAARLSTPAVKLLAFAPNFILKTWQTYLLSKFQTRKSSIVFAFDHRFLELNERSIRSNNYLLSDHDPNYLKWRYLDINDNKYAIYVLHSLDDRWIDGFIIYRDDPESSCAYVMDYLVDLNKISDHQLFLQFARDMGQCGRQSISIEYFGASFFLRLLRKLNFHPREARKLHFTPCSKLGTEVTVEDGIHFLAGNENSRN